MSLFDSLEQDHFQQAQPLAARMRPRDLQEFVGRPIRLQVESMYHQEEHDVVLL